MVTFMLNQKRLWCVCILQKGRLIRHMLASPRYEKDSEPPLMSGDTNTTASISLSIQCATPVGDFVVIEAWTRMVSAPGNYTVSQKNIPDILAVTRESIVGFS